MDSSPQSGRTSGSEKLAPRTAEAIARPSLGATDRVNQAANVNPAVPVFPFRYLRTAIEALNAFGAIPHQVDRSVWANKHFGITDEELLPAFRFLGLIDEAKRPLPLLSELAQGFGTPDWPHLLDRMLRGAYGDILSAGITQATPKHILEVFRKRYGLTPVKARIAAGFFVHAARESQIDVGPFLTSPREAPISPKAQASRERIARMMLARLPDFDETWSDDLKLAWLKALKEMASST